MAFFRATVVVLAEGFKRVREEQSLVFFWVVVVVVVVVVVEFVVVLHKYKSTKSPTYLSTKTHNANADETASTKALNRQST